MSTIQSNVPSPVSNLPRLRGARAEQLLRENTTVEFALHVLLQPYGLSPQHVGLQTLHAHQRQLATTMLCLLAMHLHKRCKGPFLVFKVLFQNLDHH